MFIVVKGKKVLAHEGFRDGKFVVLGSNPGYLDNVHKPIVCKDRASAEAMAKKFGGTVETLPGCS